MTYMTTFPMEKNEIGASLYRKTMKYGVEMIKDSFQKILDENINPIAQQGIGSYYNKINPYHHLDWHQPHEVIERIIRVYARPYFPAYSFIYNTLVSINKVSFYNDTSICMQGAGRIEKILPNNKFVVSCTDGCLKIEDYETLPILSQQQFRLNIHKGAKLL